MAAQTTADTHLETQAPNAGAKTPRNDEGAEGEQFAPMEGGVSVGEGHADLQGLLLELIAATAKLTVLLTESDPDGFDAVKPRLTAFKALVVQLPDTSRSRRKKLGFDGTSRAKPTLPRTDLKLQDPRSRKVKVARKAPTK